MIASCEVQFLRSYISRVTSPQAASESVPVSPAYAGSHAAVSSCTAIAPRQMPNDTERQNRTVTGTCGRSLEMEEYRSVMCSCVARYRFQPVLYVVGYNPFHPTLMG